MLVTLIQRPTEVKMRRHTVLLDGRQCGYFYGPRRPLIFTSPVDDDEAELVRAEVAKLQNCEVGKCVIPPAPPPEWSEPDPDEEEEA